MEGITGQIILFAGNFSPAGWAFCEGQRIPVSDNALLFSILEYDYGGEEGVNFALPDMEGLAPEGLHYIICIWGD